MSGTPNVALPHPAHPIFAAAVGLVARKLTCELGRASLMPAAGAIEPLYI